MPPTKTNVRVGLACARSSLTNFISCITSSFCNLSFSLAFLLDTKILYWRKILAVVINVADVNQGIIKNDAAFLW